MSDGARRRRSWAAALFLAPALVLLGAIVVYPIFFSVGRSLFDASGSRFVGVANYREMVTSPATLTAIKNNLIWVVFAPSIVTALGLVFAVLTERIAWSTAFKVAVFMPMAISFLSAGVTWRL
ncbi:MAG TPA: sugar ABC transporter permease, partial [Actinomycetota bacterium]